MSNYTLESSKGKHKIVENKTQHIVFETRNKRQAHKKLVFYNMGGAFDGWTPSFFLVEMPEIDYSEEEYNYK